MVIKHLGHASFRIKGAEGSVITDPFSKESTGINFPRTTADIVTVSHQHADHNNIEKVGGDPFVIDGPGEYEIGGVRIQAIPTYHDDKKGQERGKNIVYLFHMEDMNLLHCGDLGHKLEEEHIDLLEVVDILFVPVGGIYTIDAKEAAELAARLEPSIVIPMHYNEKRLKQDVFGKLDGVGKFLDEMGEDDVKKVDKLVVSKSKLPEEMKVVVFK